MIGQSRAVWCATRRGVIQSARNRSNWAWFHVRSLREMVRHNSSCGYGSLKAYRLRDGDVIYIRCDGTRWGGVWWEGIDLLVHEVFIKRRLISDA